ncbi:protein of unknown function 724 1 [Euphorbia peplus]|nr:protein of unknown function 724 1 [Euphorbia peplus]
MGKRSSQSPISMAAMKDKKSESFTIDSMVEVSREEDEGFQKKRGWYVAKLLNKSLPNQKPKFVVQYKTLFFKSGPFKKPLTEEITNISFIRPLPPPPAPDQTYEVYDAVDAFHRDGWWRGVVSKVEVFGDSTRSSYTVVFENPPQKLEFSSENLRFRSVLMGGKWVRSPKQQRMKGLNFGKGMTVEVNLNGEISQDAWFPAVVLEEVGFNSFVVEYWRSSNDGRRTETFDSFQIRPSPPEFEVKEFEIHQCVEAFHDSCWKKGIITMTLTRGRYSVKLDSVEQEIQSIYSEIRPQRIWKNGKWVGFKDYVDDSTQHSKVVVSVKSSSTEQAHSREKSCRKKTSDEMDDAYENTSVKKSRKDPPVAIQEDNNDAFGQQDNVSQGTASEMETETCASEKAELSTEKDNENGVMVKTLSTVPVDVHAANQALSTCFVGCEQAQGDSESAICQEMPFEKSSSLWKHLDSLDVFQLLPQKPHFSPLYEVNEATREGFAIAHLLNFANVVDKTSQLQVETPREVIDSYLKALSDLEVFGFDVKAVIERINRLLSIKTRQEQLDNQSQDMHSKIAECDSEKAKMQEEINAIVKMISVLKEQQAVNLLEKAKKDDAIKMLQIDARSKNAEILSMKLEFEREVAAPW